MPLHRLSYSKTLCLQTRFATQLAPAHVKHKTPLITCRRQEYDHFVGQQYKKFDEIPLTSKGWNHHKSKGDYFVLHPNPEAYRDQPRIPFEQLDVDKDLLAGLNQQNVFKATWLQEQCYSYITQGKNTLVLAETGSGKTLAYSVPLLQRLINGQPKQMNAPRAVIITPSRELAYQVCSVIKPLAEAVNLKASVLVGGRLKRFMLNPEFSEIDLLVSSPGALGKLSTVGLFRLNDVISTVLDEADTLIDDSFVDRMTTIIKRIPQSQLTLVSATNPKQFPAILEPYESTLTHITSPLLHKPLSNITQKFIRLKRSGKPPYILEIVKSNKGPLIIFTNRSDTCNWLGIFFGDNNVSYARINGKMSYDERIAEWNKFVDGKVKILISTDVGSRGLDTTQVGHIVNYDFPVYAADYLHRIGRTGRFGSPKECKVTNFVSGPDEIELVQQIELAVRKDQPLPNVDGNITKILHKKIMRNSRETSLM